MNTEPSPEDQSSGDPTTSDSEESAGDRLAKPKSAVNRGATTAFASEKDTKAFDLDEMPSLENDRYELFNEISRGGMGLVYHAHDHQLKREVAVKVLRSRYQDNQKVRELFANEAYIMGYLSHPGVPPIYECGHCDDGRPYHVMKLIDGVTLADLLARESTSQGECFKIFADVCETLAYAHSCEVLHLDLKPANIMVGAFGEVHVMDWGLARFQKDAPESSVRPRREPIHGTPEYMSPEQANGQTPTSRTDVFGLGAILCEIILGHAPYAGRDVRQVLLKAVKGSVSKTLSALEKCGSDPILVRLAKSCLSPRAQDRPRDAMVIAREVADYQETALKIASDDMTRFFELSLDLFCIAGLDGYFRRINSNFTRLLGYSEADLLSNPFLKFVHPRDRASTTRQMGALRKGQPVVRFRNRYQTAAGEYLTLEWTAKSIEKENLIFAVARDVTLRAKKET